MSSLEVRFGQLYGFIFSPRPRTPAARYPGRVPRSVAGERLERLFALQATVQFELNQSLIGRHVEVLVDGPAKRGAESWQGRGPDNRVVNFPAWQGIAARRGRARRGHRRDRPRACSGCARRRRA